MRRVVLDNTTKHTIETRGADKIKNLLLIEQGEETSQLVEFVNLNDEETKDISHYRITIEPVLKEKERPKETKSPEDKFEEMLKEIFGVGNVHRITPNQDEDIPSCIKDIIDVLTGAAKESREKQTKELTAKEVADRVTSLLEEFKANKETASVEHLQGIIDTIKNMMEAYPHKIPTLIKFMLVTLLAEMQSEVDEKRKAN